MNDLIVALGLVLVLEGMLLTLFPGRIQKLAIEMQKVPESTLRGMGLFALLLGFFVVWLIRG